MANINGVEMDDGENLLDIPEMKDTPISPQMGIAAIAMNFALKYCDTLMVKDGALYQQYKLEGRNMPGLHLDEVFYVATQIEKHLLQTPSRLALTVLEAVAEDINDALDEEDAASGIEGEAGDAEERLHPEGESPAPKADAQ